MSDPRQPDDRDGDGELERLLRASLNRNAEDAPDAHRLADRALARLAEQPSRRRRPGWRRTGAPLIAAASVAAVVAAGLVGTLIVHERQQSSEAAASRSSEMMMSQPARPVSPLRSSAPNGGATPGVTRPTASPTPVPANFRVRDLSFLSEGQLGFAVGRLCASENSCSGSVLAASQDGGQSWTVRSTGQLPGEAITSVRFASPSIGYAYGPSALYRTGDGGVTWQSMDAGGAVALEAANGVAVRLTASAPGCTAGCTYAVSTSDVDSGSAWKTVSLPRPATGTRAFLVRTGGDVYLAAANGATTTLFYSGDDGASWRQQSSAPCAGDFGSAPATLRSLASTTSGAVVALCASRTAASVQVSLSRGAQFSMPATAAPATVATSGTPAVAAFDAKTILVSADKLYRSTDGGESFTAVQTDAGAGNPRRVVFLGTESDTTARWVCGNGSTIWTSTDTGATWDDHNFS